MNFLVTGASGFIGSNMVDYLLARGHVVIGVDNLSTGQERFLENAALNNNFILHRTDLLDSKKLPELFAGIDTVFHFAANADVRFGINHPRKDLEQNTIGTFNVLEAMRINNVKNIVFSSTGSVYGEATTIPTPENSHFPIQTSLYGASKVAGEGLISAYCEGFGMQAHIFRFVSILGHRYTHGHVYDFYMKLKNDPTRLNVLGNGKQRKSYLHVFDCIEAIMIAINQSNEKVNIYNLGNDSFCEVNDSISWICDALNVKPEIIYSGGSKGWIGDNPFIYLDTSKIRSLGWLPKFTIQQGVLDTVKFLKENEWVFEARK